MARKVKTLGAALGATSKPLVEDGLSDFVQQLAKSSARNDLLGIGNERDRRMQTSYNFQMPMQRQELENLFENSWAGNRVVTLLPDEMTRAWRKVAWEDSGEDEDSVIDFTDEEERLDVESKFVEALYWARLYGGALIIPGIRGISDDELSEPLDIESVGKGDLEYLHVIDRWRVAYDGQWDYDPRSPHFGLPTHYILAESSVRLHWTRVIRVDGKKVPYFSFRRNGMWHASVLQCLINNLKNYDTATAALAIMLFESNVDVIGQSGLAMALTKKDGATKATDRWTQAAILKAMSRILVLDKDTEEYNRHPYSFSGVEGIYDKICQDLAGAADVPLTKFFGQSPGGLNSPGDSEDKNFNRHVAARQKTQATPVIRQIDQFLARSALGRYPEGFKSEWCELTAETKSEKAQREKTEADRDKVYFDMGIGNEVMWARFLKERGVYPGMTEDDVELTEKIAEENKARMDVVGNLPPGAEKDLVKPKKGLPVKKEEE